MIETPRITELPEQQVALIRVVIPRDQIQTAMGASIAELTSVLKDQGIPPTGPWFTHHLHRPTEVFDLEICFPIASTITHTGRVGNGFIAARTVVQTVYSGGYHGLPAAWGEFQQWIEANGHAVAPDLFGPNDTPDPTAWRTQLNRPIAAS